MLQNQDRRKIQIQDRVWYQPLLDESSKGESRHTGDGIGHGDIQLCHAVGNPHNDSKFMALTCISPIIHNPHLIIERLSIR